MTSLEKLSASALSIFRLFGIALLAIGFSSAYAQDSDEEEEELLEEIVARVVVGGDILAAAPAGVAVQPVQKFL